MKFAHSFAEKLQSEAFPQTWVDVAIPYGQLKKCLKQVQRELEGLGLGPEILQEVLEPNGNPHVALKYDLDSVGPSMLQPHLTVLVHLQGGTPVHAELSPATRQLLRSLMARQPQHARERKEATEGVERPVQAGSELQGYECFEVSLQSDGQFFNTLLDNVVKLSGLQSTQERSMSSEILALGRDIRRLSKPTALSSNDLKRWRAILGLYLDAQVFFGTREEDHGYRSSEAASKRLVRFQQEMNKQKLCQGFRLQASRDALNRFIMLNTTLLASLHFQEINQLAVTKILKKFVKRTSLMGAKAFPSAAQSDKLLTGSVARDICAQISTEVVSAVPQVNDYLCPVCLSITIKPVRLECQHVYCLRCVVKMQRRHEKHCPLCRSDSMSSVSAANLDAKLERFLRKYFPCEVKEKEKANELERGIEQYGPGYRISNQECCMM